MIAVPYISLAELQHRVRQTLEERFALPVWVSAEISEIKVNTSGHCYLELIEKGGDNGVPKAQARAVIWRSQYLRISAGFEAETGQRLAAGIRLLAKVTVNYHEVYGFSLQILDIDPSYTLGDMERQRQQTIARLQAEGVWEMNRSLGLPAVVQRIAVVSSSKAAGYQDFCNELRKSPYRFVVVEEKDRDKLARLYEQAARNLGACEDKVAKARSKAFKGPMIAAFIVRLSPQEEAGGTEALLTAGAALGQFMQALAAAGFGGIVLSGSLLADASLQSAFCRDAAEKLVAWITIGTPKPDAPKPMPEDRQPVLSVWEAPQC